jgi:hypothetical protein
MKLFFLAPNQFIKQASDGLVKESSAWKQRLYAGKLGAYDFARILNHAGYSNKATENLFPKKNLGPMDVLFPESKRMMESRFLPTLKGYGGNQKVFRESAKGLEKGHTGQNRDFWLDYGEAKGLASPRTTTRELGRLSKNLRMSPEPKSLLDTYNEVKSAYKEYPNRKTTKYNRNTLQQLDTLVGKELTELIHANRHKRKIKKLWGLRHDLEEEGLDFYLPTHKVIITNKKPRFPFTLRHEVAHGKHYIEPDKYEKIVVPKLTRIIRQFPHLGDLGTETYPEAIAQIIAGSGGSRSAARFNSQFNELAKSNKWPATFGYKRNQQDNFKMQELINSANKKDSSGITSSVLTQLHKNYNYPLPYSDKKLPLKPYSGK